MRIPGGAGGRLAFSAAALALWLAAPGEAAALDAAETRGKQIYFEGTSPKGAAIDAIIGEEAVTLPASAVPCGSCHGPDGLGREEGGLIPSDIRWSQLTKAYGHVHENGRRHPAFDEDGLARVLRTGLDPAQNRLDHSMPLYQMSDGDMADLLAYLRRLEHDRDPGVDEARIQVGTLLPLTGRAGPLGRAMAQAMHAYFQDVNQRGGVYGRRVELLTVPYGDSRETTLENLKAAFREEGVFALVGAYTVDLDQALLELLRADNVPLVGPFTLDPGDGLADAAAFYLYPGFDQQARVLAQQALAGAVANKTPMMVLGPEGRRVERLVAAVGAQLDRGGGVEPLVVRYAPGRLDPNALAAVADESGSEALFFFGAQPELEALLRALADRSLAPRVYLLSAFLSRPLFEAPAAFHHRIFIAYPTFSSDISQKGRADYGQLAERHGLPREHVQAQIAALAAAKLLVEGLRRAGRSLSRQRLVQGLEALYAFDTGLTPPLTYGPNRRIGARGAHVIAVDLMKKAYQPVGGWHELP